MKIAIIAPFEEQIPPTKYGGTELVVYNLAEELIKIGQDVTLFASGDSRTNAKLIKCVPKSIRTLPEARNPHTRQALNYQALANAVDGVIEGKFDIVHNNFGWPLFFFKNIIGCPIVTTLHGTLSDPTENLMYEHHKSSPYISISNSQRRHGPNLNYISTIYNGIDPTLYDYNGEPEDYLAFLGRISPEKGVTYAIEIAKKTNNRLIIAAKVDAVDRQYYEDKVEPLIDGKQIQFIGEVDHKQKAKLLRNAKALLSPLQWDEPFGLVNTEAMACGTPVIAINRGSMPELINDTVGILCSNVDEMIERVADIGTIDRKKCRQHVEKNFSAKLMAQNYLSVYKTVIG